MGGGGESVGRLTESQSDILTGTERQTVTGNQADTHRQTDFRFF